MKKTITVLAAMVAAFSANAAVKTAADYDVGDYVQDGLIAHYDGIRNAGANLPHDSNAAQWADLAANGVYATPVDVPANGEYDRGSWTSNAWHFAGYSSMLMSAPLTLGADFTIQFVLDVDVDSQNAQSAGHTYPAVFTHSGNDTLAIFMNRSYAAACTKTNLIWKTDAYNSSANSSSRPVITTFYGKYLNAAFDSVKDTGILSQTASFTKSGQYFYKPNKADQSVESMTYCWGARPGVANASTGIVGDYHAVRIYSRKLTDEELAWNMVVDECRFRGGALPRTNVVVEASTYAGVCGTEASGVYEVVGSHTFTAPDVTVGGVTYSAVGYTLETWNGSYWASAERFDGNSYTYTVSDGSPKVRLTWLWKPVRGIRTASDWDAGDYVQGGFIAQYDGIRNAGANLPHDASATVWQDLKSSNFMTFEGTNAEAAATGSWVDGNAYSFVGFSYARMAEAISMGSNITVQLAVNIDNAAQVANYNTLFDQWLRVPLYFSADDDYGVFANVYSPTQTRYLQWKDRWTGSGASAGRANFNGWNYKYITAVTTDEKAYLFQTEDYGGNPFTKTRFLPFENLRWSLSGSYSSSTDNMVRRYSIGKYYSARFYNRPLTSAELSWNRKVDEIRFRGVVVTNVVVASDKAEAQGVQPNGVYEVLSEGTFTAEPVSAIKGGAHFTYVPTGYTVERLVNGTWSAPVMHDGSAYTYDTEDEDGAIVRLTWKWRADGLGTVFMVK